MFLNVIFSGPIYSAMWFSWVCRARLREMTGPPFVHSSRQSAFWHCTSQDMLWQPASFSCAFLWRILLSSASPSMIKDSGTHSFIMKGRVKLHDIVFIVCDANLCMFWCPAGKGNLNWDLASPSRDPQRKLRMIRIDGELTVGFEIFNWTPIGQKQVAKKLRISQLSPISFATWC